MADHRRCNQSGSDDPDPDIEFLLTAESVESFGKFGNCRLAGTVAVVGGSCPASCNRADYCNGEIVAAAVAYVYTSNILVHEQGRIDEIDSHCRFKFTGILHGAVSQSSYRNQQQIGLRIHLSHQICSNFCSGGYYGRAVQRRLP